MPNHISGSENKLGSIESTSFDYLIEKHTRIIPSILLMK